MKRRAAQLGLLLVLAILLCAGTLVWLNREPEHEGRPLSEWARQARSHHADRHAPAAEALRAMGEKAVPSLARTLARPGIFEQLYGRLHPHVPSGFQKRAMGFFGAAETIQRKIEALAALQIIGTNAHAAVPALARTLSDSNVLLSSMAATTLAEIGPAAVPELTRALDQGDYNVRANACRALARLGTNSVPAAERLAEIIRAETGPIVPSASYTLARIGPGAMPPLAPLLSHTNAATRQWAAYSMIYMFPPARDWVEHLYPLTADEQLEVRLNAVQALGHIRVPTPATEAALRDRFADPEEKIRAAAIQAMANMPRLIWENLEPLALLLEDPSPRVRGQAAEALMMGGVRSAPALPRLQILSQDEDEFAREQGAMALRSISAALAKIRNLP